MVLAYCKQINQNQRKTVGRAVTTNVCWRKSSCELFPLATTRAKVANSYSGKTVIARYPIRYFFSKKRPSQEGTGSGLTASAPVSDVSAPVCTNGYGLPCSLWVWRRRTNRRPVVLLCTIHRTLIDCTAWRFLTVMQWNCCLTHAPRSGAAKQWSEELAQEKKKRNVHATACYSVLTNIVHKLVWLESTRPCDTSSAIAEQSNLRTKLIHQLNEYIREIHRPWINCKKMEFFK